MEKVELQLHSYLTSLVNGKAASFMPHTFHSWGGGGSPRNLFKRKLVKPKSRSQGLPTAITCLKKLHNRQELLMIHLFVHSTLLITKKVKVRRVLIKKVFEHPVYNTVNLLRNKQITAQSMLYDTPCYNTEH